MIRLAKIGLLAGLLTAASPVLADVPVIEIREAGGSAAATNPTLARGVNSAGNEMVLLIQQLQDEVRSLRGTVEQQQRRLDLLEQQQRDRYRDIDRRLSVLFQALPEDAALGNLNAPPAGMPEGASEPGAATVTEDSAAAGAGAADAASAQSAGTPASSQPAADQSAYEAAYGLIRQRDFAAANEALSGFISSYPDSGLIPNAWYWKGEVHLAQQELEGARQAFTQVLDNYAGHSKAPDAMYKLGVLFGRSGDTAGAEQMMRRVVETYPQSSAAELAKGYLAP